MMRRFIIYIALLAMCLSCSRSGPRYTIGVSQCSEDIWRDKLNDELRRGIFFYDDVNLRFASADDNDQKQIEQIDAFVNEGIDLLIVSPNQVATISPAIDRAFDKGIPVIVFDRKTNSKKFTAFIGADNAGMGREMGEYIASRLRGNGNVVEIRGLEGSSPAIDRHKGFVEALSKYPGIRLVASLQGDWTEKSGHSAMENLLKTHPGNIDFVFGQNDRMAVGAYKACQKDATVGHPHFCGIDALPTPGGGMENVRDGILDASYIYPTHGDEVIQLAMNILEGNAYQKENPLKAALVTKENARVLLMQNEEIVRQDGYLTKLKEKADSYLQQLSSQRLITLLAIGLIGFLLLSAVVIFLYYRQRSKIHREREQMARTKLDFYTQVSHELRTPLTLIDGPLTQLGDTAELRQAGEKTSELFAIVRRNTDHLTQLVNKILDAQTNNELAGLVSNEMNANMALGPAKHDTANSSTAKTDMSRSTSAETPRLLIVDDNPDIRTYLHTILENKYEVMEAADGKLGLEAAHAEVPDLIISDVMMPEMNGLEFCQQVKQNMVTSHIPVILLTARALSSHQIEGYESGADAYLTKPFSPDVLMARVDNLLKSRHQLKNLFGLKREESGANRKENGIQRQEQTNALPPDTPKIDPFLLRFRDYIENHMPDSELSVETIGSELGLSRVQLYRKVKALTGQSPVELLRKARLEKGRQLLKSTDKTISEVAYEVGFSAPSYFTKCFKDEYGVSPSDL